VFFPISKCAGDCDVAAKVAGFIWVLQSSYVVASGPLVVPVLIFVLFSSIAGSVCDEASTVRAGGSVWVVNVAEKDVVTGGSVCIDTAAVFSIDDVVVVWFVCVP